MRRNVWVSHFSTCPKAEQFSGGGHKRDAMRPDVAASPVWIEVSGRATYEHRGFLSGYGFRWNAAEKLWAKRVPDEEIDLTIDILKENLGHDCSIDISK